MVAGILNLSNYNIFVNRFWNASVKTGAGLGGLYWIVKDHGGHLPLDEHIYGAGFCMLSGAMAGLGALVLYPVIGASMAVGLPAYGVQQFRAWRPITIGVPAAPPAPVAAPEPVAELK